jgi:hypothetical protein
MGGRFRQMAQTGPGILGMGRDLEDAIELCSFYRCGN